MVENCRLKTTHVAITPFKLFVHGPLVSGLQLPTPWPLSAEGTIATRLIAAIIQKIVCIGPMKRPTLGGPDGTGKPAKTACKTLMGILVASTANEIERLRRAPVVTRLAPIRSTPPLLATGADLMIELMLGATNIPPPAPTRIMRVARTA